MVAEHDEMMNLGSNYYNQLLENKYLETSLISGMQVLCVCVCACGWVEQINNRNKKECIFMFTLRMEWQTLKRKRIYSVFHLDDACEYNKETKRFCSARNARFFITGAHIFRM